MKSGGERAKHGSLAREGDTATRVEGPCNYVTFPSASPPAGQPRPATPRPTQAPKTLPSQPTCPPQSRPVPPRPPRCTHRPPDHPVHVGARRVLQHPLVAQAGQAGAGEGGAHVHVLPHQVLHVHLAQEASEWVTHGWVAQVLLPQVNGGKEGIEGSHGVCGNS